MQGLEVISDKNTVQINSNYMNVYLDRVVRVDGFKNLSLQAGEFACFYPDQDKSFAVSYFSQTDGSEGFKGYGYAYVFSGKAKRVDSHKTFGLEVYTDDGKVAYSSSDKPLKVVGQDSLSYNGNNFNLDTKGKKIGILPLIGVHFFYRGGHMTAHDYMTVTATRNSRGVLNFGIKKIGSSNLSYQNPFVASPVARWLYVDLTGY